MVAALESWGTFAYDPQKLTELLNEQLKQLAADGIPAQAIQCHFLSAFAGDDLVKYSVFVTWVSPVK